MVTKMPTSPMDNNDLELIEKRYANCIYSVTVDSYLLPEPEWMTQFIQGRWHSRVKKPHDPRLGVKYQFLFDNEQDAILFGLKYS